MEKRLNDIPKTRESGAYVLPVAEQFANTALR